MPSPRGPFGSDSEEALELRVRGPPTTGLRLRSIDLVDSDSEEDLDDVALDESMRLLGRGAGRDNDSDGGDRAMEDDFDGPPAPNRRRDRSR